MLIVSHPAPVQKSSTAAAIVRRPGRGAEVNHAPPQRRAHIRRATLETRPLACPEIHLALTLRIAGEPSLSQATIPLLPQLTNYVLLPFEMPNDEPYFVRPRRSAGDCCFSPNQRQPLSESPTSNPCESSDLWSEHLFMPRAHPSLSAACQIVGSETRRDKVDFIHHFLVFACSVSAQEVCANRLKGAAARALLAESLSDSKRLRPSSVPAGEATDPH